jgi:hypothetical protein
MCEKQVQRVQKFDFSVNIFSAHFSILDMSSDKFVTDVDMRALVNESLTTLERQDVGKRLYRNVIQQLFLFITL